MVHLQWKTLMQTPLQIVLVILLALNVYSHWNSTSYSSTVCPVLNCPPCPSVSPSSSTNGEKVVFEQDHRNTSRVDSTKETAAPADPLTISPSKREKLRIQLPHAVNQLPAASRRRIVDNLLPVSLSSSDVGIFGKQIGMVGLLAMNDSHYSFVNRAVDAWIDFDTSKNSTDPLTPKSQWEISWLREKHERRVQQDESEGKVMRLDMGAMAKAYDLWYEGSNLWLYTSWLGVHMQQDPHDMLAIQEMIWTVKPDLIIEMGTNAGGGTIFYASVMQQYNPKGKVVTFDTNGIEDNHVEKDKVAAGEGCMNCIRGDQHPLWHSGMIDFYKMDAGSQPAISLIQREYEGHAQRILVIEDANHHRKSVLRRMKAMCPFVTLGSYCLVQDTKMLRFGWRQMGPLGAINDFLRKNAGKNFTIDRRFEYLMYSQHHKGYLRRRR